MENYKPRGLYFFSIGFVSRITNLWGLYVVKWAEEITNVYKKFNEKERRESRVERRVVCTDPVFGRSVQTSRCAMRMQCPDPCPATRARHADSVLKVHVWRQGVYTDHQVHMVDRVACRWKCSEQNVFKEPKETVKFKWTSTVDPHFQSIKIF